MKICSVCKKEKDESLFSKKGKGLQSKCKECHSIYLKQHYKKNKDKYYTNIKRRKKELQQYIRDQKSKPCTDCKRTFNYWQMDFDHLYDKKFNLHHAYDHSSLNKIKLEIAKCELVCANCHRDRTFKRLKNMPLAMDLQQNLLNSAE